MLRAYVFFHQISNFSHIQKSPNHPGGGWGCQENYGFFSFFVTFLYLDPSLIYFDNHLSLNKVIGIDIKGS